MQELMKIASCNLCKWKTYPILETSAMEFATLHVIKEHPDDYTRVIGKDPPVDLDSMKLWELEVFTDPGED